MDIHTCKQCGKKFAYCRACVFWPIYYKDDGFCSEECYDESVNQKEVIPTEDVEVVVIKEDTSTPTESAIECPYFFTATKEEEIMEKEENKEDDYIENNGEIIRTE